jgi:hypothetical protein
VAWRVLGEEGEHGTLEEPLSTEREEAEAARASLKSRHSAAAAARFAAREARRRASRFANAPLRVAGMSFLPLRLLQRMTRMATAIPPTNKPTPMAIARVSVLPAPAFGTESPALIMVVTFVPVAMVGADVAVTPKKELAANASANTEVDSIGSTAVVALAVGVAVVALAVGVLTMMFTWVDAALAVILRLVRPTE